MPGPTPKDPNVRARRNKSTTRRTLSVEHDVKAPPLPKLPDVEWLPITRKWWRELWASGMAPEYLEVHRFGLFRVAMLFNKFFDPDTELKQQLDIQVRLEKAEADYGINPMAMRRLEWQIEETEDKQARGNRRRTAQPPADPQAAPAAQGDDPRLKLVSSTVPSSA